MSYVISYFEGFDLGRELNLSLEPVRGALNPNWLQADFAVIPGPLIFNLADPVTQDQPIPGSSSEKPVRFSGLGITTPGVFYLVFEPMQQALPVVVVDFPADKTVHTRLRLIQPVINPGGSPEIMFSEAFRSGEKWNPISQALAPDVSLTILARTGKSYQLSIGQPVDGQTFRFSALPL